MSKYFKILLALLVAVAIATPALALDGDFGGFLQVRGVFHDNMDGDDDIDDTSRGVDQRFRLYSNFALHENVKAVFKLEIDSNWGDRDTSSSAKEIGALGADAKGEIEVKNIYLDFDIPAFETNVKAGTQYTKLANGFINGDDATSLNIRYTPNQMMSLFLVWLKAVEGDFADDGEDGDYYHLGFDYKTGGLHLNPYVAYYDISGSGNEAYFLGADVAYKMDALSLAGTVVVNDWEIGSDDGNGLVLWGKLGYNLGASNVGLEAAWYGDEDATGGNFVNVNTYNNFAEIITGGKMDGRGGIGTNQRVNTSSSAAAPYLENYFYIKVSGDHKLTDACKLSAAYIYAEQAEDPGPGTDKITFGHEIDAYLDHTIVKGLTFTVGGGYLIADDDFGDGDDAWKAGTLLTYSF